MITNIKPAAVFVCILAAVPTGLGLGFYVYEIYPWIGELLK